jgi:hypothetical protein
MCYASALYQTFGLAGKYAPQAPPYHVDQKYFITLPDSISRGRKEGLRPNLCAMAGFPDAKKTIKQGFPGKCTGARGAMHQGDSGLPVVRGQQNPSYKNTQKPCVSASRLPFVLVPPH